VASLNFIDAMFLLETTYTDSPGFWLPGTTCIKVKVTTKQTSPWKQSPPARIAVILPPIDNRLDFMTYLEVV
jgi:hypothetical protein